ncbi:hypothetical protein LTSEADE_2599 [Salmonella enterica subsp. enterica serovar Adelaide str. A4-669]|uniref:Uncharacterized protein n=1 Tax=Salmonella enterica subsp. enterica serovar Adelaide str. A4-669 TaxID=913063 RepID=A0A6C8GNU4_SALET|nr:hypothetical protein LTSEADE_2599 [Salmonella enterica subsp. enterica serovar Adelaide str. A4-669]
MKSLPFHDNSSLFAVLSINSKIKIKRLFTTILYPTRIKFMVIAYYIF